MTWTADTNRYKAMTYRRCGRSGLLFPALSLGMWHNFGEVDDPVTAREMVLHAFDRGITHFDLANGYGPPPGSAESFMGRMLKGELGAHRDELLISTKAGFEMWPGPYGQLGSRKYLLASLDQSLKRLGLNYVDIFYSHRPDYDTPFEETMGALASAVQQGKALYVGLSNYRTEFAARAIEMLEGLGVPCLIHQPPYSIFNRWVLEEDFLPLMDRHGTGVITFSPLAQGLLTDKYLNGIPDDSRAAKAHGYLKRDDVDAPTLQAIKALNGLAKRRGQSLAQMALAWNLRHPQMTSVIIGASRVAQIDANLGALENLTFSEDELRRIEAICAERTSHQGIQE